MTALVAEDLPWVTPMQPTQAISYEAPCPCHGRPAVWTATEWPNDRSTVDVDCPL